MRFDLFHELSLPPGDPRSEARLVADWLDEVALADGLGYGCAWLVEHHFMRGYSHSSKPELLLAAASQRASRIGLGLAVVPLPLHHPVHVAERIATLDLLSGGRAELGIGRGFAPAEYECFGADMAESRALVEESLEIVRRSFAPGPVDFDGRHFRLEARDLVPRCPRPVPLWTAAVSPSTFDWAGRQGLGVLVGPFKPWPMVERDIRRYRAACAASGAAPRVGLTVGILCLEDDARARALAKEAFRWFYGELYRHALPVLERLYPGYEEIRELGRFRGLLRLGIELGFLETFGLAVIGTPAQCVARLRRFEAAGVTHLLCAVGAGAVPGEVVRESLQVIATGVMPHFAT